MGNQDLKEIAKRLELTRAALGYPTQAAFAAAIGGTMTPQKWNNYAAARDRIPLDIAVIVCKKFALSLDWIYLGDINSLSTRFVRQLEEAQAAESEKQAKRRPRGRS